MENRDHISLWKKFVCSLCAALIFIHPFYALANPQGGVVSAGQATISENNTTVRIDQQSERAVIDWRGFDIAPGEHTQFNQPSSSSITLNRVNSGAASHIDGLLSANGNLVIINENGVVFGKGAQVDVNSLVASTADTTNENFMAGGKLILDKPGNPDASIVNEGTITAKEAGLVGFVAPRVENHGVITARMGRVHLASGDTATIDFYGDGLLEVAVSDKVSKQLVTNTGTIAADGGLVAMTAAAGKNIVDSVINGKGTLQAKSVGPQNGKILIAGNKATDVIIDGLIDASGLGANQTGGAVHILGNRIALMNNSSVTVSGNKGAGEILIGGDYHGDAYRGMLDKPVTAIEWGNTAGGYSAINRSPTAAFFAAYYAGLSKSGVVPTASRVFVDKGVVLNASGIAGNAGRVITWSNNGTAFYGHVEITAKGISGNGGFAEVSGKDWLSFAGTVDARALHGRNGSLLLDPADITISTAPDSVITGASPFDSTGGAVSNLNVTTLETALAGGSVIITSAAGVGGNGDITFLDAVNWNSGNSLTVSASQHIYVNNTITNLGTGSITLNAVIAANGAIAINNNISTGGSVTALAMGDLTVASGATVATGATGSMSLRAANGVIGGTGNLTIDGNLAVGTGTLTLVSGINGTRPDLTLNSTNFTQLGANVGVTSITGFQDVTISTNFAGSGNITINPQRDFTLGAGQTLSSGFGTIAIFALRNITANTGSIITTASTGSLSLQAAGGSVAGTGNLTLSGNISVGSGPLTLVSGINGTRPSWTMDNTSFTMLAANVGTTSISGFQDITISRNFTGSGAITISPQRDFILSASQTIATAGSVTILAQRDLTTGASSVISTGTASGLSLQAANGSTAGTGNLTLGGNLSVGTGSFTLTSGINGTRPSWTINSTSFTMLGASVGVTAITGFLDVTLNSNLIGSGAITINPQQDFILTGAQSYSNAGAFSVTASRNIIINNTFNNTGAGGLTLNANVAATGSITVNNSMTTGGSITMLAKGDLTVGGSATLTTGATGALSLQAANAVIGGTGNLTISGNLAVGTGNLTLLSGINGTRPSIVLNGTNLNMLGATVGVISITGFQDVTLSRSITSTGNITITPQRDFILSASQTLAISSGASTISILAQRDITTGASSVISTGTTGGLSLTAANNLIAGTGNLTIGGSLSVGTGALTLLSGINGTRPSLVINSSLLTTLGATIGAININGFQDVTVSRSITGSGAITINPQQDFILSASQNMTGSGAITVLALRDITLNASSVISTGAAGSLSLRAANAAIAGTGNLTLGGSLSVGTGTLTLLSGINGTRPSWVMDGTSFTMLGATVGITSITGFQDVTVSRNFTSSGNITISPQRDFVLSASQTLAISSGASTISITALRDITTGASSVISTGTTGGLSLLAANNVVAGTGNLTLGGKLSVGTGVLTLTSGINGTRPSWTINSTSFAMLGATVGVITINGLQDITQSANITSSGSITINPQRDYILSASNTLTSGTSGTLTILTQRDLIANASSIIATASNGALSLRAANGSTAGTGNLTLSGSISVGTGALTLLSGINGTRPSWTMNSTTFTMLGASVGTTSITGFLDMTIDRNFTGSGAVTINTSRDFVLSASRTITSGGAGAMTILAVRDLTANTSSVISTGASGALSVRAANGSTAGTGNLTLLGNLSLGTGALTLVSGINGTRPSWTMNTTTFTTLGATVGAVAISGFLDYTLNRNLTSTGAVSITASRDLNINASNTLTGGSASAFSLLAANNVVGGTGKLTISGNLSAGSGNFTLLSGINGTRPTWTADATTLAFSAATVGAVNIQGFANITMSRAINSTSTITMSNNTVSVLGANITSTAGQTYSNAVTLAEGASVALATTNAVVTFSTTLNGTAGGVAENLSVNAGTGTVTFTGIVGGTAPLGDLSVTADNLTITANMNGSGDLAFQPTTAARIIVLGGGQAINLTTNGFNLSSAELGRLVAGWSSVSIGNATAGSLTNSYAAWTNPVSFITGSDFTNATAITASSTVFVQAAQDVILTQSIATTNTSSSAITLVAGRNFTNNFGASALTTGAGGRWLVYSANPTDSTGEELLSNAFNRYTCTYGGACPTLSAGNGLLYSYTPMLDVTIDPQTYNYGDAVIAPTGYTLSTSGYINALDLSQGTVGGTGNFTTSYVQGNNAGTGFTITNNGSTFSSNLGYGFNYVSPSGLTVGTRSITLQVSDQTVTYGNSLNANAYTVTSGSFYNTDAAGLVFSTNATLSSSGNYNASGTPWSLTASGVNFTSGLAANYSISYVAAPTGLTVNQRSLAINATGTDRVYNGLAGATVTLGDDRVVGDVLTTSYTAANFADKNVGTAKSISVTGLGLSGTDSGNYTFNTTAAASADVTQRSLTITATGTDRVYNGLAGATVTLGDDRVAGDVLTTTYTAANFADKNVGTAKSISVTGIGLSGTDSGNYTYNTTASASADVTQRSLTITATGTDRVYNGLTGATVTLGDDRVAGDVLTTSYTAANFADKNVGTAKSISVTGIGLSGTDSGNYTYNTTASASADVTQRSLTITATGTDRVYNGLTGATVTLGDDRVAGDVLTTSYTAANFANKNVGTAKSISVTGLGLSGTDSGNYTFNTSASASADITQRSLTISATGTDRVYNGLTGATVTLGDDRVAGDVLTTSYTAANFANKNVGTAKSINVTGIGLSGTDSGNYTFNTTASASADITQRSLTISATGTDRVYNGLTGATVTLGDDRVAGDVLTTSYTAANFNNKNAGVGKSISVTGIGLSGTDSGNYTFNTTASASADITQRSLTISATGTDRVYNGLTGATVTLGDNRVAGDVLTTSYTAANFNNKNAGVGKSISVTGIGLSGTDSGNYTFNTTASASADVTQRSLTISATGANRVYNGLTGASVTLSDNRVAGDVLTTSYTVANFNNKNAGVGKSISVTGIGLSGTDSGNYTYNATASASADITKRALTINASGADKVYNGLAGATVSLSDNRVAGDVFTTSYIANFVNKNAGIGKTINVSGITLSGTDSGNYSYSSTATTTADITQRSLTISATGTDRVYNGLTGATVVLSDDRVAGDVFTTSYIANFANKNVGAGKAISVTGIGLSGTDSGNYTYNTTASTTADITQRSLLITATGTDRAYNGLTGATVTLGDNRVAGDVLTTSYTAANFADNNVGVAKAINVTGISITGADSANYSYNTFTTAYASITGQGPVIVVIPTIPPVASTEPVQTPIIPLAMQIPNTVKKSLQDPLPAVSVDHIPEFLLFDDEWQKRQHRLPTLGMLR